MWTKLWVQFKYIFSLHNNQISHQNAHNIPTFSKSSVDVELFTLRQVRIKAAIPQK